ncbi:MAG: hypothetical protein JXR78_12900 [Victivallales bacterium]|nr:hypothetical protein [Victivallales bacterium]
MKSFSEKFITGVNYWASDTATEMWSKWNENVVDRDFEALAGIGTRVVRVFPLWPDFQPITRLYKADGTPAEFRFGEQELPDTGAGQAGVDEEMMARFERFADLASRHGLTLIVALLTGHMTARLYMPPGLVGKNPITDPDAMLWQQRFVSYFVKRMKHHPAISAWEFGNECNYFGKAATRAESQVWMALISNAIKLADPGRPLISGMDGHDVNMGLWSVQDQAECCDVLTTHHYSMWRASISDSFDTIKPILYAAGQNRIYGDIGNRDCFMEEIGSWRGMMGNLDNHASYLRGVLWNLLTSGGGGLLWWCAFDQDAVRVAPYDWDFAGLEHGMLGADHTVRATGAEMKKFRGMLDTLPFSSLPCPEADAICILGDGRQQHLDIGVSAFILGRQAGLELRFHHARKPLPDAKSYMLPSACGKLGLGGKNWQLLRERVAAGATLYVSVDDVYIDNFAAVFGAELTSRDHGGEGRNVCEFSLGDDDLKLELPWDVRRTYRAIDADILGRDSQSNPVFFEHSYGLGKVFLMTLPLERLMMEQPMSYLSADSGQAWKLYRYLAGRFAVDKCAVKNDPFLSITEHCLSDGTMVLAAVNLSNSARDVEFRLSDCWRLNNVYPAEVLRASSGVVRLNLPGNGGALCTLGSA